MSAPGSSHGTLPVRPEGSQTPLPSAGLGEPGSRGASPPSAEGDVTVISQRQPVTGSSPSRVSAPPELGAALTGQQLDHFMLLEYVGGGGMGAVFRGLDTMLNREVAIKVLSRDQAADEETRKRFQNEAQSAARLDHENIARVYYVGQDKGLYYIVLEFIEGINLRDLVQQHGPRPQGECVSVAIQIAQALAHASSRDIVHRDIKPSNVIVASDGRVKLVDMGLARLHQVNRADDLTASGVTLGTFDYISPEQAYDPRHVDVRSDIYSLGCTLYFMLTGRPPFPTGTVLQKLLQHKSEAPADPRELNPALDPALAGLILKTLAKDPRKRHQSAEELVAELVPLAARLAPPSPRVLSAAAPDVERPRHWIERHVPWLVPVATLAALVIVLNVQETPSADEAINQALAAGPNESAAIVTTAADDDPGAADAPGDDAGEAAAPDDGGDAELDSQEPDNQDSDAIEEPIDTSNIEQEHSGDSDGQADQAESSASQASEEAADQAEGTAADDLRQDPQGTTNPTKAPANDPQPGRLVVRETVSGPGIYPGLREAASAAQDGDIIELQYTGKRVERPLILNNIKLTIRAGEGFQPVVVFKPNHADPAVYPRSMISIGGGSLKVVNVAFELDVPRIWFADWTMFEARHARSLELQHCVLTIRNGAGALSATHPGVAFFRVRMLRGAESMMMSMGTAAASLALQIQDCVVRGEAVLLRVHDSQGVHLTWRNGLVATTERLLVTDRAMDAPPAGSDLRLDLSHLTAVALAGMCSFGGSSDPAWLSDARIKCTDSILQGGDGAALIEHDGLGTSPSSLQQHFGWDGDRNFYPGFSTFWRLRLLGREQNVVEYDFEEWQGIWTPQREFQPTAGGVVWKRSISPDQPMHARGPDDYALADSSPGNTARGGAGDGRDAGFKPELLPDVAAP